MAVSPKLFHLVLQKDNLQEFFNKNKDEKDFQTLSNEFTFYLLNGPILFTNKTQRIVKLGGDLIGIIVQVFINMPDNLLIKESMRQSKSFEKIKLDSDTITGDMTILLKSLKPHIPRESYEEMIVLITRIEEQINANETENPGG